MLNTAQSATQSNTRSGNTKAKRSEGLLETALTAVNQLAEGLCKVAEDAYPVPVKVNVTNSGKVVGTKALMGMSTFICLNIRGQIDTTMCTLRSITWYGRRLTISYYQKAILSITLMASKTITALKTLLPYNQSVTLRELGLTSLNNVSGNLNSNLGTNN